MAFLTYIHMEQMVYQFLQEKEFSVNITDKRKILADLENVKKRKCRCYLYVNMHWGDEYSLKPNSNQKKIFADFFI